MVRIDSGFELSKTKEMTKDQDVERDVEHDQQQPRIPFDTDDQVDTH